MINRWIGIAALLAMLAANSALFVRDLLPSWTVGTRPDSSIFRLKPGDEVGYHIEMYDADGQNVGDSWTLASRSTELLSVRIWTIFKRRHFGQFEMPRIRVTTEATFDTKSRLSSLRIRATGVGTPLGLQGDLIEPNDFSCVWKMGDKESNFILPADALATVSDVTRPFDNLAGLYVGQTWRMQLFNPLASLLPALGDPAGESVLVRVSRKEVIPHDGQDVETFVVDAERVRAWVAEDGRVLRQEIDLPVLGKLTLVDAPYSDEMRRKQTQDIGP
jgi:hypothetical protein